MFISVYCRIYERYKYYESYKLNYEQYKCLQMKNTPDDDIRPQPLLGKKLAEHRARRTLIILEMKDGNDVASAIFKDGIRKSLYNLQDVHHIFIEGTQMYTHLCSAFKRTLKIKQDSSLVRVGYFGRHLFFGNC
jgi:hypothetical protein